MKAAKFIFFLFGIFFILDQGYASNPLLDTSKIQYDPLPAEKQGRFPIHIPEYNGVDQLLHLSNQWLIVVTVNIPEVLEEINQLTDGKFNEAIKVLKKDRDSWKARKNVEEPYNKYIVEARNKSGERNLDKPDFYQIKSSTDENYLKPQNPLKTTRYIASLDKNLSVGEINEIHYAQYSYLEMPFPLKNGNIYTISVGDSKSVTFLYDELKTISRAIKVNQVGYLPESKKKYAYLGCYLQEFGPMDFSNAKEFSVIDVASGDTVLKGEIKIRSKNPKIPREHNSTTNKEVDLVTGEDTYEIDLSPLKNEGEFFISIPGVGRSWTFRHASDVYGEAFFTATRGLYHQRCGIAIGKPYTPWPRIKCHTGPVYESEDIVFVPPVPAPEGYEPFDIIGATFNKNIKTDDATGGWHDAADWDRNSFHFYNIFDLLYAYELSPNKFYDGQLNIPESGNGIPDILDEAEYGLKVWKKSMDSRNGVSGEVETWTHPSIDDPKYPYAFSQRTRWSSLLYAAAAAQYAYLVKTFDEARYKEYAESALKAYEFGNNPKNSLGDVTLHAKENRGSGKAYTLKWHEENDYSTPFLINARLRLYILTEDMEYLKNISELLEKVKEPYEYPFSYTDYSSWLYFSIFAKKVAPHIHPDILVKLEKHYLKNADELLKLNIDQPYRQSWPLDQNYWMSWGATTMTNRARVLFIAYYLSGKQEYKEAAILNTDYMLGINPMGMSWTTGLGFVYPIAIQHAVSEDDGIKDPVPGITIFGGNDAAYYYQFRNTVLEATKPDGSKEKFLNEKNWDVPLLRRWSCHPHFNTAQCEFTVYQTMSSTIFATAFLMSENWMPSENLKNKNPRQDDLLFGYWYLP